MVARPTKPTRSGNAGEMSPDAAGRVDIKQYYSALLKAKNVEPVPQGGIRQMGGTRRVGPWRRRMLSQLITGAATSGGPHTGAQTVWTGTVAGPVAAVFVDALEIDDGTATFQAQALVGGVWTDIGRPFNCAEDVPASRLAAYAPGGQQTATSLRIRATFSVPASVTIGAVSAFFEGGTPLKPRYCGIELDDGTAVSCFATENIVDFYTAASGFVGAAWVPDLETGMLPDLDFYSEGRTVGLFHGQLETLRAFLATPAQLHDWKIDLWPYAPVPVADLGDDYPKTDDIWDVVIRSINPQYIYISITVNGETIAAVPLTDNTGTPKKSDEAGRDWTYTAAAIEDELETLPSLGVGVTCVYDGDLGDGAIKLLVTFGGDLSGEEYQLSAIVTNTAEVSALATHTQVGETELEALFSASRGWPGAVARDLVQDRFGLSRIPASPGALALSRQAEYFDFNVKGTTDNAARLDRLRSQTNETVLHIVWSTYLLAFTTKGAYFVPNRTIERNTPLNFVKVSDIGAQPNAKPFLLDGDVHYVGINPQGIGGADNGGNQILKAIYDDVGTKYQVAPISLLASHLIAGVIRSVEQKQQSDLDAARTWLMRRDGRLVVGQAISSQEIIGFVEWIAADNGGVAEFGIDGANEPWLAVQRTGANGIERYDTAIYLQDAVDVTPDLVGKVTGLDAHYPDGTVLYAVADGWDIGPFTVDGGEIDLEDSYTQVLVGRWQPPYAETMPEVFVTGGDEVIWRPGRIHTVSANLIDTTSLAIGANGQPPVNFPLLETTDPVDAPMPGNTRLVTAGGLLGAKVGTTAVFTQTRPGKFRIRDFSIGAKL